MTSPYRLSGLFSVIKPSGWTSSDVVTHLRSKLSRYTKVKKLKVGHAGTLDPFATGVLVIGVGDGCKELSTYLNGRKEYIVTAKFGDATDTMDREGKVIKTANFESVTKEKLTQLFQAKYFGKISQIPPAYSAKKIDGMPSYTLARSGKEVEHAPVIVTIHDFEIMKVELPFVDIRIDCSKGTYIRKLVHDVAEDLGTAAHASELVRTKQHPFMHEFSLAENDWQPERIISEIRSWNARLKDPVYLNSLKPKIII